MITKKVNTGKSNGLVKRTKIGGPSMTGDFAQKNTWGVIFDMDGVLIDSYRAHFLSWQRALHSRDLKMTEEQFAATFGQTNLDIFSQLYPSLRPEEYATLAKEKEDTFREIITEDFPEMDGAGELVEALYKAGAALGIGSSGPPENVETVLNMFHGGRYFIAVTNGKELTRGKPDPEVFLKTIRKLALPPEVCIVVEDAPAGVTAGRVAGCAVVAVTGTVSRDKLAHADLVVDSLRELNPKKLKDLISASSE